MFEDTPTKRKTFIISLHWFELICLYAKSLSKKKKKKKNYSAGFASKACIKIIFQPQWLI